VAKGTDVAKVAWSYFLCVCLKKVDVGENGCETWLYTVAFMKYNTKIVEISKIDIPDTHRHDHSFSWLCTCTSLTSGGLSYSICPNLHS
jgi:hypothetical protein